MKKTVWLKWDGIYNVAGICNQALLPLNDPVNEVKAIKQRLLLLGFRCGPADNNVDDATKLALLTFNSYCDHPAIHMKINPCGICDKTLYVPFKWCRKHGNASPPADEWDFTDPAAPAVAAAAPAPVLPAPAPVFYDADTIRMLESLDDNWLQPEAPDPGGPPPPIPVDLSRSRLERTDSVDFTLNSASNIAVKIVSAPRHFLRFAEFAAVNLEINGFENVKKLLFSIYKNFDPATDGVHVENEKLIYQEVIYAKTLKRLPIDGPGDGNNGQHAPAKGYILGQMLSGVDTGFFGNYLDKAYDRLHAEYKVVVWVSNDESAFDPIEGEVHGAQKDALPKDNHRHGTFGTHDTETLTEFRRSRSSSLSDESVVELISSKPEFAETVTVHDRSNAEEQAHAGGLRQSWSELRRKNILLRQPDLWTEANALGTNLIGERCAVHDAQFLRRNEIVLEEFPNRFRDNPVASYRSCRERYDADGENFRCRELTEVLFNVGRHINIIRRRLCCGQWAHVGEPVKGAIVTFMNETIEPELGRLLRDQCPYDRSIVFCNSFMFFFSFVVHKAVGRPELDFFATFGLQENQAPVFSQDYQNYLKARRNKIDGNNSEADCEYGFYEKHPFDGSNNPAEFFSADAFRSDGYFTMKRNIQTTRDRGLTNKISALVRQAGGRRIDRRLQAALEKKYREMAGVIVLPSYNPLDVFFFDKIRAVPMFMVGMFDLQYLCADGIRQIPVGFFEHDLFHVNTGQGVQQHPTLFSRLCDLTEETQDNRHPPDEFAAYAAWQGKIDQIMAHIERRGGDMRFTLEFVYFFILHEPSGVDKFTASLRAKGYGEGRVQALLRVFKSPTVAESNLIAERMAENVLLTIIPEKIKKDFFGSYAYMALDHLETAFGEIIDEQLRVQGQQRKDIDSA